VAYSVPAYDDVDFSGTGVAPYVPRFDQVNFLDGTATGAYSGLAVEPAVTSLAGTHRASAAAAIQPAITSLATVQVATCAAAIAPAITAQAWKTFFASAAASVRPVITSSAAAGTSSAAAVVPAIVIVGRATPVRVAQAAVVVQPFAITALAGHPSLSARASVRCQPVIAASAAAGVAASAAVYAHPVCAGRTARDIRSASSGAVISISCSASAQSGIGTKHRASARVIVRPAIAAAA
jgi:hypothetical protein